MHHALSLDGKINKNMGATFGIKAEYKHHI